MLRGLQTHFNAPVDAGLLQELAARGVQLARIDAQQSADELLQQMVDDVLNAGLVPLVVLDNERQLAVLPTGTLVYAELLNEPDLAGMPPQEYQARLAVFAEEADARGITPCAPVISNLVPRGFRFLRRVCPLPAGVLASIHRYPPVPSAHAAHDPFETRGEETMAVRAVVGLDRPFGVSEFGYNSADQSDDDATQDIRAEFAFWLRSGAAYAVLYQLNDGPTDAPIDRYGVRTMDGQWKPQMDAFSPPPMGVH